MKKNLCGVMLLMAVTAPVHAFQVPEAGDPTFKVDPTDQKVSVFNTKDPTTTDSAFSVFNSDKERFIVRPSGSTLWTLHSLTGESGQLAVTTPGGGVGVVMFVPNSDSLGNLDGTTTRFDIGTWGTHVNGGPVFPLPTAHFGFNKGQSHQAEGGLFITKTYNYVGVNASNPQARLEVRDGGIRINNESNLPLPTCNADTRGFIFR